MPDSPDVNRMLPLSHLSFHILLALTKGDQHGYSVIKQVRENPANRVNPGTGTFYSAIRRMQDERLIAEIEPPQDESADTRRRYYSITDFGSSVLRAETERLELLVRLAHASTSALSMGSVEDG